jgi:hypothetical protein
MIRRCHNCGRIREMSGSYCIKCTPIVKKRRVVIRAAARQQRLIDNGSAAIRDYRRLKEMVIIRCSNCRHEIYVKPGDSSGLCSACSGGSR